MSNRRKSKLSRIAQGIRNRCQHCKRRVVFLHKGPTAVCPDCGWAQR